MATLYGCWAIIDGQPYEMTARMTGRPEVDEPVRRRMREKAAEFEDKHGVAVEWVERPVPA